MFKHTLILHAARSLIVVAAIAGLARADDVWVRDAVGGETSGGAQPGVFVIGTGSNPLGTVEGDAGSLFVGTFDLEADYGGGWESLLTYCLQADEGLAFGLNPPDTTGFPYDLVALTDIAGLSMTEAGYVEVLWANAFNDSTTDSTKAAAFQAIVWELVHDDAFDLDAGDFQLDSGEAAYTQANIWFGNITDGVWTDSTPLFALTSDESQDIITPVPEPMTMLLLGAGLGGLALRRRTRA
jgi:hypothetical protein